MSEPLHCINHPNVETYLRCNRCGQPICSKCAVRTPVGYRCKNCISSQQQVFYAEFRPVYYLIAVAVALPLSLAAGWLLPLLGWYTIVLGPLVGTGIAELTRLAIRRRRGRHTWLIVCGCVLVGGLLPLLSLPFVVLSALSAPSLFEGFGYAMGGLGDLVWRGVYLVTALGAVYWRLRPGKRV